MCCSTIWYRDLFVGFIVFQAEGGIRDYRVTGVQTCALPISQDRAGVITAEQVVAALEGELVSNAVNIPRVHSEDLAVLEPYLPLCSQLGRLAMALPSAASVDRIEASYNGNLSAYDTRLLTLAILNGAFQGRVDENVNFVNAP